MPNIGTGIQGAAGGAAAGSAFGPWGTAIGAGVGGLAGLFGGSDGSMSDADRQKLIDLYQGYLDKMPGGVNGDPRETAALDELKGMATGSGMTPDLLAEVLHQRIAADTMARGRESAIQQREAEMGRGVANSGQSAVMQAQSAQDAATRAQTGGVDAAGIAAANKRNALGAYMNQLGRLDSLRMSATGGLAGAYGNSQNYHGAQEAANNANLGGAINTAGNVGLYLGANGRSATVRGPASANTDGSLSQAESGAFATAAPQRVAGQYDQTSPAPAARPTPQPIDPTAAYSVDPTRRPVMPTWQSEGF